MRGARNRHHRGVPSYAIILLLSQLFQEHNRRGIPPVTLASIVGQILIYFRAIPQFWSRNLSASCLSARKIIYSGEYSKLFVSQIEHAHDGGWHLYYNMISFLVKGQTLERRMGTTKYLTMLFVFIGLTGLSYVGLNYALSELLQDDSYMNRCAVGFSGVIFALKVLTTHDMSQGENVQISMFGIPIGSSVNAKYSVWFELILISVIAPNASFIGHLAGILVGLAYIYGPLKPLVDLIHGIAFEGRSPFPRVSGSSGRFTRTSQPSGYRASAPLEQPMHREFTPPGSSPSTFRRFTQTNQPSGYWTPPGEPLSAESSPGPSSRSIPNHSRLNERDFSRSPTPPPLQPSVHEIRRRRLHFYGDQ